MRQLLNLAWGALLITALALPSCATHKQLTAPPTPESQPTSGGRIEAPLDSMTFARNPTLLDKLFGRTPTPVVVPVDIARRPVSLGKKSMVNVYYGTVTTVGKKATAATGAGAVASVIEKKAGPAIVASDSSTQNAILGGGNLAAVHGDGNHLEQTKADVEPPGVGATIAKAITTPVGYVVTVVVVAGVVYGIILWRKKKAVETLV